MCSRLAPRQGGHSRLHQRQLRPSPTQDLARWGRLLRLFGSHQVDDTAPLRVEADLAGLTPKSLSVENLLEALELMRRRYKSSTLAHRAVGHVGVADRSKRDRRSADASQGRSAAAWSGYAARSRPGWGLSVVLVNAARLDVWLHIALVLLTVASVWRYLNGHGFETKD